MQSAPRGLVPAFQGAAGYGQGVGGANQFGYNAYPVAAQQPPQLAPLQARRLVRALTQNFSDLRRVHHKYLLIPPQSVVARIFSDLIP